jgi:hypothetical protein
MLLTLALLGQISTKIYDKRDHFNFKIINFPNMCINIPASPAYGVYISQLIRYARVSSIYSDFLKRHLHLRNRQLDQGYKKICLKYCIFWLLHIDLHVKLFLLILSEKFSSIINCVAEQMAIWTNNLIF